MEDDDLSLKDLFDKHLFRMRRWSRGETGLTNKRYGSYLRFTEDFIDDFKGVDLNQNFPYLELYRHIENSLFQLLCQSLMEVNFLSILNLLMKLLKITKIF